MNTADSGVSWQLVQNQKNLNLFCDISNYFCKIVHQKIRVYMNRMTYFQYLFSDKKAGIYWIFIFLTIVFFTILNLMIVYDDLWKFRFGDYLQLYSYFILFFIIYIGFYTSGFMAYRLQNKFTDFHHSMIKRNSDYEVLISQDRFTIKPLYQSNDVKLSIPLRKDLYQLCTIGDSLIILGHVYDLGVFRRHLKPLQIDLNNSGNKLLTYAKKPKGYEVRHTINNLEINFSKSVSGINTLTILNFKLA